MVERQYGVPEKRVFICYRDQDSSFAAARIAEFLKSRLGSGNVFRYVETVGVPFDEITKRLLDSDVVLIVIGCDFRAAGGNGRPSLDDPNDFLRVEIEYAFARGLPVVPVLVENASLGYPDDYPDSLKPLARVSPIRVFERNFDSHAEVLLDVVRKSKPTPPPLPKPHEKIGPEDLVLIWRSWRSPKHDHRSPGGDPVYRFDVVIGAPDEVLDRIERVVYFLPPAWVTSPASITDRGSRFRLKEIAWWDLTVRARVYVRDQAEVIPLSSHVWLSAPERI